jgi:DNA-binding LacI/PurR family transcriptional regulator
MPRESHLFGRKIAEHHLLTFSDQIYEVFVEEIEAGRWEVGDRLPGLHHLAKELGFGTKTIQKAYDRLRDDGYVEARGYRGTFLASRKARSFAASAEIGLLVDEGQKDDPLILWYEHVIRQQAQEHQLGVVHRFLTSEVDTADVNQRGKLFPKKIQGIISLAPMRLSRRHDGQNDLVPLVFLCPPFESCVPRVSADVRDAYFDLTSRAAADGHEHIVFSEDAVEPEPRQTVLHRLGYLEAMALRGLAVDEAAIEKSREVDHTQPHTVVTYLRWLMEGTGRRPTVVIAGSLGRAMAMVKAAGAAGVKIPDDLSVLSIGSAHVGEGDKFELSGALPDFDFMVERCLKILNAQGEASGSEYNVLEVRMHFVPGDTYRPLTKAPVFT